MQMIKKLGFQYLYLLIVLIIIAIVLLTFFSGEITKKDLAATVLAALGTFLGALFAFRLNENKENSNKFIEQRKALGRALFILARQTNAIQSLKNLIEPYKSEVERAINLPAFKTPQYVDLQQKFEDLEFLLEGSSVNILMRLTVEQERFHQCIESIRLRSDFYVQELQLQLEKHSFNGRKVSDAELENALGKRVYGTAISYAQNLYYHVYECERSIKAMHIELFELAKKLFPKDKFVTYPQVV